MSDTTSTAGPVANVEVSCPTCEQVLLRGASTVADVTAVFAELADHVCEPPSVGVLHVRHYRYCNCLGDASECCDVTCPCHEDDR